MLKRIACLLIAVLSGGCQILDKGQNKLIKEYYNSQQSLKVIVFEKRGNATVDNSIQASIEGYDYELTDEDTGNVFIADQFEGLNRSIDSLLIVNWIDEETVEFTYPVKIRTLKRRIDLRIMLAKWVFYTEPNSIKKLQKPI